MAEKAGVDRMRARRAAMAKKGIVEAYAWVPENQKRDLVRFCAWLCEQEEAVRAGRTPTPMPEFPDFYGVGDMMLRAVIDGLAPEPREVWDVEDDGDPDGAADADAGADILGSSVASVPEVELREWLQLYYTRLAERGIVPDVDRRASDWAVVQADPEAWLQRDAVAEADRIADRAEAGS